MNTPVTLLRADLEFLQHAAPLWREKVFAEFSAKDVIRLCTERGQLQNVKIQSYFLVKKKTLQCYLEINIKQI